ncbi:MAG: type II toxin-antitoxin system RelE/ParE family toxin [Trueperaceae bacterium]|nr:type II toxin-antitoxin system RelE/ParE family toxin [Trueperaceae bacterium]
MRVRFTPQAAQQYLDALRNLRTKNAAGASTVQQRTEAVVALLREHPHAGHAIPEFPELPHRELSAPPYRLFYRVVDDTVWIVRVSAPFAPRSR